MQHRSRIFLPLFFVPIEHGVNTLKGKGKIHGSAVFKCKSEEEKIIELKRKSSNAVSARLYRKRFDIINYTQYTLFLHTYFIFYGPYHMAHII